MGHAPASPSRKKHLFSCLFSSSVIYLVTQSNQRYLCLPPCGQLPPAWRGTYEVHRTIVYTRPRSGNGASAEYNIHPPLWQRTGMSVLTVGSCSGGNAAKIVLATFRYPLLLFWVFVDSTYHHWRLEP